MGGGPGGGEGPGSGEAPGLARDQAMHWPPPCGHIENCRVGAVLRGEGRGECGQGFTLHGSGPQNFLLTLPVSSGSL